MRLLIHLQPKNVCELFEPEASHEINSGWGEFRSFRQPGDMPRHGEDIYLLATCTASLLEGGRPRTMYEEVAQKAAKFAASSCGSLERTFVEMMKPGSERRSSLVCMIGAGLTAPKIVVPPFPLCASLDEPQFPYIP
jgi:hypothetical protein